MSYNKTNNHILLLFFMVLISCINAQLELIVDFTSTSSYVNYQCGDLNVFPPCKTLSDAGERSRQYVNSINTPTVNPSVTIKLRNSISNPIISGNGNEIGNLYGFCSVSLLVDQPSSTSFITIDGALSSGPFISLEEPTNINPNIQCTAGTTMSINYLTLTNWLDNEIIYLNVDQSLNNIATNKAITLSNVNVINSSKVVIVQPKYSTTSYGTIKFTFKLCNFESLYSSPSLPPFYLKGVITTFNNCNILNSELNSSELIYVDTGSISLTFNFKLTNVDINPNYPIISTLNIGTKFSIKYGLWSLTTCSFSNLIYQRNTLSSIDNPLSQNIQLIKISSCTILSSSFASNSLLYYQSTFDDQLDYIFIDGTNVWEFTTLPIDKALVYLEKVNYKITLIDQSSVASTFDYPIISQYSYIILEKVSFSSSTPLIGSHSTLYLNQDSDINYSNFNLCSDCIVMNSTDIIFNNTI